MIIVISMVAERIMIKNTTTIKNKLKQMLLWNAVLRTIMQTSLEFTFCAIFTLTYAENDRSLCAIINYVYAYVFAILVALFSVFSVIFYRRNF